MGEVLSLSITISGSLSECYPPYRRIAFCFLSGLFLLSTETLLFLEIAETLSLSGFVSRESTDLSRIVTLPLL